MPLAFKKHITPTVYNAAGIELIDGWWGHQPWRPGITTMLSVDGWWAHQPWRPGTPI